MKKITFPLSLNVNHDADFFLGGANANLKCKLSFARPCLASNLDHLAWECQIKMQSAELKTWPDNEQQRRKAKNVKHTGSLSYLILIQ